VIDEPCSLAESRAESPGSWTTASLVRPGSARLLNLEAGVDAAAARHVVRFYDTDPSLTAAVRDFLDTALRDGGAGAVIASERHRTAVEGSLRDLGIDLSGGRFASLDALQTLTLISVDGMPDPVAFDEVIGGLVARTLARGGPVGIFGEMVSLLLLGQKRTSA
jgi:hypothetical protein